MIRPLILAATLLASPAAAFTALNGQFVQPAGPGQFLVSWRGKSGARYFWCAAGDYVVRDLGLPSSTRIYRYDSPPRGQGEGILFGLDPSGAKPTGLLRISRNAGITAATARTFCEGVGRPSR